MFTLNSVILIAIGVFAVGVLFGVFGEKFVRYEKQAMEIEERANEFLPPVEPRRKHGR